MIRPALDRGLPAGHLSDLNEDKPGSNVYIIIIRKPGSGLRLGDMVVIIGRPIPLGRSHELLGLAQAVSTL